MRRHADRLRRAFDSRRLDRFIRLMDPEVTWRGDYPDRGSAMAAIA